MDLVQQFRAGVAAYDKGQYQEAVHAFEGLLQSDAARGHVLYNLGNAYYKLGQRGSALAAYYASRQLLPRDPDLKANTSYLENFNQDKLSSFKELPLWLKPFFWLQSLNAKEVLYLATGTFALSLWLLGLGLWVPSLKMPCLWAGALVFFLAVYASAGALIQASLKEDWGAVIAKEQEVFSSKSQGAAVVFILKEGAPVMVKKHEGEWVKIEISDGKQGWLPQKALHTYGV